MTHLRRMMLDELQRRNYAQNTVRAYIKIVERFAKHFGRSPERLGPEQIREYQVHLFRDRHLSPGTVEQHVAALRLLYVKTLKRRYMHEHLPMPKRQRPLPDVLSLEEVQRLLDAASNLYHRAMLMTLYATGMRRAEMCRLKVGDIDSQRMIVHIRKAMLFGGMHGLLDLNGVVVRPNPEWKTRIVTDLRTSTDEVRDCAKRAEFAGRWLAGSGSSGTAMAILGVRP